MVQTYQNQQWLAKDRQYIWHSMKPYNPDATLVVTEAKGCWVTDHTGKNI